MYCIIINTKYEFWLHLKLINCLAFRVKDTQYDKQIDYVDCAHTLTGDVVFAVFATSKLSEEDEYVCDRDDAIVI